jgi:hypothetical protein
MRKILRFILVLCTFWAADYYRPAIPFPQSGDALLLIWILFLFSATFIAAMVIRD